MSTEYRIRFENNEVVISTRHLLPPERKPSKDAASVRNGPEGVSLGQSLQQTWQQAPAPAPGAVRNSKGSGEPSPADVGGEAAPGGITIVFGSVNYCCCGGGSDDGSGETSSTEVPGITDPQ